MTSTNVIPLVIALADSATVYAGTFDHGVFKSTDRGASWTPFNTGLSSTDIEALAVDPRTATTVYAGANGGSVFRIDPPCAGDCSVDGDVMVDDLLTMVNVALGKLPSSDCVFGDANHDGKITINEILAAINHALTGCPLAG